MSDEEEEVAVNDKKTGDETTVEGNVGISPVV